MTEFARRSQLDVFEELIEITRLVAEKAVALTLKSLLRAFKYNSAVLLHQLKLENVTVFGTKNCWHSLSLLCK